MTFRLRPSRLAIVLTLVGGLAAPRAWADDSAVAELCNQAEQGTWEQRYAAIDDLGERAEDPEDVVPVLTRLLADGDQGVRWRAARSLGDYGTLASESVPALRELIAADEPLVRMHATVALGRIGDTSPETIRVLLDRATDAEPRVARVAIAALKRLEVDPEVVAGTLAAVLESNDEAVTSHALEAVIEAGGDAVPLLKQALKKPQTAYLACVAIEAIGPPAAGTLPELSTLIDDTKHSKLQIEAILAVAKIGPAARSIMAPKLTELLGATAGSTVPAAAAYALGAIGAAEAVPALNQAAAAEGREFLQMVASWSLAKLQPASAEAMTTAIGRLTQGLASDDATMRAVAARGLLELNAPKELAGPALLKVAEDPDPIVRGNVLEALASLEAEAVPIAIGALQNPKMRLLAVQLLARLGKKSTAAVEPLTGLLGEADDALRPEVHLALAAIGPASAPATSALAAALDSDSPRVRHTALRALHQIGAGASGAREQLLAVAEAQDAVDAVVASWVLTRVAADDPQVVARILPVLEQGLVHPEKVVRLRVIESLVDLGPAAAPALPALMRVAQEDDQAGVRAEADLAVQQLSGSG